MESAWIDIIGACNKIYVVLVCVLIIFVGFSIMLLKIDKKVNKLLQEQINK